MNTLYIIGNGFDLYHNLDTRYSSFGLFLKKNNYEIYEYFINYLGLPELDEDDLQSLKDPLWSHFEESLAGLNIDEILSEHEEFAANPASNDFSDGDWDTIEVYVSDIRDAMTVKMFDLFKQFINNVVYPGLDDNSKIAIDQNALFLNFNYTRSLEHYYLVASNSILFIHNAANSRGPLILGHGMNPASFKKKTPQPPKNLNEEELERWHDDLANSYDLSIERGRDALIKYFKQSFKSTSTILENNTAFFDSLNHISKVIILGHSLSDVDKPYIEKVIKSVDENAKWVVSYYGANEKNDHKNRMLELGVKENQLSLVTMSELK